MDLTNLNKDRKARRKPSIDLSSMVYGKVPPQAKDLEEAVLGAIMLEKSAFDTVAEILKPECFYVEAHQRIFKCMQGLQQKNQPIDILTVVEELKSRNDLEMVGGPYFVTRLTNAVVSSANIEAHARIKNLFSANSSASAVKSSVIHMKTPPMYSTCSTMLKANYSR